MKIFIQKLEEILWVSLWLDHFKVDYLLRNQTEF